jgi:hypothetical protein
MMRARVNMGILVEHKIAVDNSLTVVILCSVSEGAPARGSGYGDGVLDGYSSPLLWSPDGSRLLLADASAGTIVVYGPDQLPR